MIEVRANRLAAAGAGRRTILGVAVFLGVLVAASSARGQVGYALTQVVTAPAATCPVFSRSAPDGGSGESELGLRSAAVFEAQSSTGSRGFDWPAFDLSLSSPDVWAASSVGPTAESGDRDPARAKALLSTTQTRYYLYSPEFNLLAETELKVGGGAPAVLYEYIWFGAQPVAQVDAGTTTHWTFTDHLGTPLIQTDATAAVYWRAEHEPYGQVFALLTADQHQPLRLPGQEAEQLNLGPNGVTERSYNIFRWYRPGWGRYTQSDPAGIVDTQPFSPRTGPSSTRHLYGYAAMNPLLQVDPLGLRSRVCCRKIPVIGLLGYRHCYIETQTDKGRTTCGLFGGPFSGEPSGTGRIYPDTGFDTGGDCGEWNNTCEGDQCVVDTARGYANPSQYNFRKGPNSNTFAGTIARACGLQPPPVVGPNTPGWDLSPAPPNPGMAPEPVRCHQP